MAMVANARGCCLQTEPAKNVSSTHWIRGARRLWAGRCVLGDCFTIGGEHTGDDSEGVVVVGMANDMAMHVGCLVYVQIATCADSKQF